MLSLNPQYLLNVLSVLQAIGSMSTVSIDNKGSMPELPSRQSSRMRNQWGFSQHSLLMFLFSIPFPLIDHLG